MGKLKVLTQPAAKTDVVLYEGVTTSDGNVGGTTLIDSELIGENDFLTNQLMYIVDGDAGLETRDVTGFNTVNGTITVSSAFSAQIVTGVNFKVLAVQSYTAEVTDIKGVGFDTATDSLVKLHDDHLVYINDVAITGETAFSIADILKVSATEKIKNFVAKTGGTEVPVGTSLYDELGGALFATGTDSLHALSTELDEILDLTRVYAAIACSTVETNLFIDDAPTRGTIGRIVNIDLSNLASGDTYIIREYYRLQVSPAAYIQVSIDAANTFVGAQTPAVITVELNPYLYGCKITAQKTAGTDRTINYESFVEA